jgi:hypothetical protein
MAALLRQRRFFLSFHSSQWQFDARFACLADQKHAANPSAIHFSFQFFSPSSRQRFDSPATAF